MNFLVTGAWGDAKRHIPKIESMGHAVCFLQQEADALPCDPEWVEGVIGNGLFLHHPLEEFPNLRYIQLTSVGFDRVDMHAVKERQIKIHNARGVYSIPMAEFVISGVLDIYKKRIAFWNAQRSRAWNKQRDICELYGKTVCIVGCGNVGSECAKRFGAFGCRVIGVDVFVHENAFFDEMWEFSDMDTALGQADVVVLTLPLTAETRGMMNTERFSEMKPGAVLVNIARGAIVDTEALLAALPRLGGAALDVFEEEPLPPDSPLWTADNVWITPHNSFVGDGNGDRLWHVIRDHLSSL